MYVHLLADLLADDALAAGHVAVLGGVGDRVAHAADAVLVDEVHDELELVQALEVGDFRLIAGVDQGLEARADQLAAAAAEDGLLAEEVGLGLFLEGGLDDAGAQRADALGVGQGLLARLAGGVLVDGQQGRDAPALGVDPAHQMTGALGGDHGDVDASWAGRSGCSGC